MNQARSVHRPGILGALGLLNPLGVVLVLLAVSSCGNPAGRSATAESGDPTGHTYLSTEVTEAGTPRTLAPGTRIRLEFTEDGRLAVDAGCSSMSGPVSLADGRLDVGQLAGTEIGCDAPRHAQDQWLTSFLSSGPSWRVSGHRLILTADRPRKGTRIVLLDREVADPDRPLLGTRWDVTTLVDGDTASDTASSAGSRLTGAFVVFSKGRVRGSTGCNNMGGPVTRTGTHLSFGAVTSTRMACAGEKARVERHVLGVLEGRVAYHVEGDQLTLDGPDGKGLGLTSHPKDR